MLGYNEFRFVFQISELAFSAHGIRSYAYAYASINVLSMMILIENDQNSSSKKLVFVPNRSFLLRGP